jgi:immune inhibitor A
MKRRIPAVLSTAVLLLALLVSSVPAGAEAPLPAYEMTDAGPELRTWEATVDRIAGPSALELLSGEESGGDASSKLSSSAVGEVKYWFGLDDYCGYYYFKEYELRAVGTYAEVWVALDLSWTIPPAEFVCQDKPSDPRPTPVITDEQVEYILGEFDNNIYGTDTEFFGMHDYHDGANSLLVELGYVPPGYYDGDKVAIMIDNVRDEDWYDPDYPLYIGGFFTPGYETYFDRNMITIDAYDWEHRTGPNPPDEPPTYPARPYGYEGVVAHEFQHLIHDDIDSDEETFVNEGCSDFAEFICGYAPALSTHIRDTAAYPENSLVVWGDQGDLELLSDYGHAYLWTLYLYEQFGGPFIQAMVANQDNGITGIDSTLDALHKHRDFADLYHDWAVALLIDSAKPRRGRFELENLEFALDIGTPDAPNPEAYDQPGAPPWGTDYIWINGNLKKLVKLTFNGLDYTTYPTGWTSDGDVLWGGEDDLLDNWAIFEAPGGGTLTFDTYYEIEDNWDFGFVQVSTDGGYNWTSLANEYTTDIYDPSAHPKVVENVPGLTGSSGEWVTMSFDLGAYGGQDILIAFRYVTDWAFTYAGWYIDNVYVDGTLISDGSSVDAFQDITEVLPINNDFTVTFVGMKDHRWGTQYRVFTMRLDRDTEEGTLRLRRLLRKSDRVAMLVSFDAPEGFTGYAQYDYELTYRGQCPHGWCPRK